MVVHSLERSKASDGECDTAYGDGRAMLRILQVVSYIIGTTLARWYPLVFCMISH